MTPDDPTAKRLAILKALSEMDLGVIQPEMCWLLGLLAERDAEIERLRMVVDCLTPSANALPDRDARIASLEAEVARLSDFFLGGDAMDEVK